MPVFENIPNKRRINDQKYIGATITIYEKITVF